MSLEDELAKGLGAALLLLVAELGRRRYKHRQDSLRPGPDSRSMRPRGDGVPRRHDLPLASVDTPFARSRREKCLRMPDCVLVCGHEGGCYLTSWLFDSERRRYWRRLRGEPEGD